MANIQLLMVSQPGQKILKNGFRQADQDKIGSPGYKTPGHFHFRGTLTDETPIEKSAPFWACMLEATFFMTFGGQKSKLKLVLLKMLPGQIIFYLGLQARFITKFIFVVL